MEFEKSKFLANKNLRKCWLSCRECKTDFKSDIIKKVYMRIYNDGLYYICDKCKEKE